MKMNESAHVFADTKYTNCDINITIKGTVSEEGKISIVTVKVSDNFGKWEVETELSALNDRQIEYRINRFLYNVFSEEEMFRIHWSFDRSFSIRSKNVEKNSENEAYITDVCRNRRIIIDY